MEQYYYINNTDSYHSGRSLVVYEHDGRGNIFDEDKEDLDKDDILRIKDEFFEMNVTLTNETYHVFQIDITFADVETRLLRKFTSYEDADQYCKEQYTLFTDNYPFIYGARKAFEIKSTNCDVKQTDKDYYQYLIIIGSDTFNSHSLGMFDEW